MNIYKNKLKDLGGYLTDCGKINFKETEEFISVVAKYEDELLKVHKY